MKSIRTRFTMIRRGDRFVRTLFACVGLGLIFGRAGGQVVGPASDAARSQNLKSAVTDSAALFSAKNEAQAEKILFASNRSKSGSTRWYVESAQALLRVASDFAERGSVAMARDLANRALQYIDLAAKKAKPDEAETVAAGKELAGYIYERCLGDVEAAKQSYRDATILAPGANSAQQALDKLTKAGELAAKKGAGR